MKINNTVTAMRFLKKVQEKQGLSDNKLGMEAKINGHRLAAYYRGENIPSLEAFIRHCEALDVEVHIIPITK